MALPERLEAPGWVESGAVSNKGLDLLGLRLPVQAIGNSLLDGITTVTPSVRYLSFRAWIVHSYVQARLPESWRSFATFAAKVESAIAYANLLKNRQTGGLLGPVKAGRTLDEGLDSLPLERLVEQLGVTIYGSPSDQLGLSYPTDSRVPGLTKERGLPLALAFAEQVRMSDLGDSLNSGKVPASASRKTLEELEPFVSVGSFFEDEREVLIAAVIPENPRGSERHRISTYATLLCLARDLGRGPTERDLFALALDPQPHLPDQLQECRDGWLRYCIRDCLAVAHECAAAQVVGELQRQAGAESAYVDASETISGLVSRIDEHNDVLRDVRLLSANESVLDLSFGDVLSRVHRESEHCRAELGGLVRWESQLNEVTLGATAMTAGAGALALLPVAWILAKERVLLDPVECPQGHEQLSAQGWARIGLQQVVAPGVANHFQTDPSYVQVMVDLALRSVEQHLRVAWARMSSDPARDVSVLLADGDRWRPLPGRGLEGGRTASRIAQAVSWLAQLGLIGKEGVTSRGESALGLSLTVLGREGI